AGEVVHQQTMLWDAASGTVRPARGKEASHDYRYFPDPDLLPLVLDTAFIDRVKRELPELPSARRTRYAKEFPAVSATDIEVLTAARGLGTYSEQVARAHGDAKGAANWVIGEVT